MSNGIFSQGCKNDVETWHHRVKIVGYSENIYKKSPIFLQSFLLNIKASELYFERYGRKFWQVFEEFDRNQWLSWSELQEHQNEKLRQLITHAYESVPFYKRVMKERHLVPKDINGTHDLHKLPILTKDDIKLHFNELVSPRYRGVFLRHGHTSGTTGSPLNICYNIKTCVVHHVVDWRQKYWAGMKYGEPYASIQGRVIVPIDQNKPPFWRKNYINNQLFLSSFHLKEENIAYYFDKLAKDNIKFLEGYPSNVYILAMFLMKKNITFPMRAVLTSSETLFPWQREQIEKAFCCKIYDFYGMAERAVFATECNRHEGHHLNSDYGITEFLDSNNEPVGDGKLGKIVATGIHNLAMPLIRYQTNDSSILRKDICSCGRGFPLMDDVATKDESIITLSDGRLISPSVLTHPFKPMHNILESQIIQEDIDQLLVRIAKGDSYTIHDEELLLAGFQERLGDIVKVKIEYVDSIPKTGSGKFKWVISKVKPHF
jgi:phenylacetate-CoA ligase